jgi:hypothetical protein
MKTQSKTVLGLTCCTECKRVKKKGNRWEKITKAEYNLEVLPNLNNLKIVRTRCPDCEPKSTPRQSLVSFIVAGARKFLSLSATA